MRVVALNRGLLLATVPSDDAEQSSGRCGSFCPDRLKGVAVRAPALQTRWFPLTRT